MYVYLCREVHMGILHLITAVCPWWHPYIAVGVFQWSHTQACRVSLLMPRDFSALLQPHSSLLNRGVKPQLAARSKKQLAPTVPAGRHEPWGSSWSRQCGSSHNPVLVEEMRGLRSSPTVTGRWCEEPVKCRVTAVGAADKVKKCSLASCLWTASVAFVETNLQLSWNHQKERWTWVRIRLFSIL